jgi:hypothetical protein
MERVEMILTQGRPLRKACVRSGTVEDQIHSGHLCESSLVPKLVTTLTGNAPKFTGGHLQTAVRDTLEANRSVGLAYTHPSRPIVQIEVVEI